MSEHTFALLVHERPEPFERLRRSLRDLSVETYSVSSCHEAEHLISDCKPHVVFTDRALRDGSWLTILNIAESAQVPLNVVVVASQPDTRFYVSVMERGAFDFVAPPFEHESLNFVVRSAELDVRRRREGKALAAL